MKYLCLLFLLTGCFKTSEQIQREQKVDQMSGQLEDSAKLVADLTQQVDDLQERLANTTGNIEEMGHSQSKLNREFQEETRQTLSQISAQLNALREEATRDQNRIRTLELQAKEQGELLAKITASLQKLAQADAPITVAAAHRLFEQNKRAQAKEAYLALLQDAKTSNAQKNAIRYNLGLISYWDKQYESALTYFSQIYTKWPKSSYAPRSLLYIARSFAKSGKKQEASASYQELINKYPDSSQAKEAKKEQ